MARIEIDNAKLTDQGVELKTSSGGKEYASFTIMWSSSRKDRNTGEMEYGETKFVRVMAFGFQAGDIAASVKGGDRVNVAGNIDNFTWQSQNGPKPDWTLFADSVSLPVPRASQGGQQAHGEYRQQVAQEGQARAAGYDGSNDPWNSAPPAGGFSNADNPPF